MGALYLKDLADKTRRGLRGRVEDGKSGGGNSYGYDVVKKTDGKGEPLRGERRVNETEAQIVRRIFQDYAAGKSPKRIAHELNAERVPGPAGKAWSPSTIYGNWRRGTGILIKGDIVGILSFASAKKELPATAVRGRQVPVVAGVGFEPATFRF